MSWDIGAWYKTLAEEGFNPDTWDSCPVCECKPRVWSFNNGNYAKCRCQGMYEDGVSAPSVMDIYKITGGDMTTYSRDVLRVNWNNHILIVKRDLKIKHLLNN